MQSTVSVTHGRLLRLSSLAAAAWACSAAVASAQTPVLLPDTGQTTTLTATVGDQARLTVPSGVTFAVNDVNGSTTSSAASVTVSNIVLASATKQLRISLQADAATFTPPASGAATWAAGDVSWGAASWTNASGAAGTLSSTAYNPVATCAADTSSCSTTGLTFTLAANASVKRSGAHTLVVRWKLESI